MRLEIALLAVVHSEYFYILQSLLQVLCPNLILDPEVQLLPGGGVLDCVGVFWTPQ